MDSKEAMPLDGLCTRCIGRIFASEGHGLTNHQRGESFIESQSQNGIEISKVISEALTAAVMVELFPRTQIDVFIEVAQADAGTRIASLTAASVALANAGIPMRDFVVGCTVGKVEGKVVLDLSKEEDNFGQADLPVAVLAKTGEVVLIQMDGDLSKEEFNEGMSMIMTATARIHEIQRTALSEKYKEMDMGGAE